MLATQLNDKVTSGELDTNCVIRLDKYICNPIQADRLAPLMYYYAPPLIGGALSDIFV